MLDKIVEEYCLKWGIDNWVPKQELRELLINYALAAQMDSSIREEISRECLKSQIVTSLTCKN